MEEGKGKRYLAPGRQYGNALLGVCHQEEEEFEGSGSLLQLQVQTFRYLSLQEYQNSCALQFDPALAVGTAVHLVVVKITPSKSHVMVNKSRWRTANPSLPGKWPL